MRMRWCVSDIFSTKMQSWRSLGKFTLMLWKIQTTIRKEWNTTYGNQETGLWFSVCKVADYSKVNLESDFCFIGKTDEENSLVCLTEAVPDNTTERDDGWKAFRIQGVLDFHWLGYYRKYLLCLQKTKSAFLRFPPIIPIISWRNGRILRRRFRCWKMRDTQSYEISMFHRLTLCNNTKYKYYLSHAFPW